MSILQEADPPALQQTRIWKKRKTLCLFYLDPQLIRFQSFGNFIQILLI